METVLGIILIECYQGVVFFIIKTETVPKYLRFLELLKPHIIFFEIKPKR